MNIWWQKVQAVFYFFFGRNYKCGCGHTAKWKTILTVDGHSGVYELQSKKERKKKPKRKTDYCPQCWAEAAIKCAWCEEVIVPGNAITLYTPTDANFEVPEHAVVYNEKPLQLVGCLRWNCAETGADRAGFWIMPGKVDRVLSPHEQLVASGSEEPIIVNDLLDPAQAIRIQGNP